jgi:molybdenum cofactor cytidylyltransferase
VKIAALILAGGASTRMGQPKALLDWNGRTILERIERLFAPYAGRLIIVTGHEPLVKPSIGEAVRNPDPGRGMLSSLQCGLRAAASGVDAAIFLPVDYPAVQPGTIAALRDAWHAGPASAFVIPRCGGRRGHPILVTRRMFPELLALEPAAQARELIRSRRDETVYVDVPDEGILFDIDTPGDYQALLRRSPAGTEPSQP